jgi:hypothetical protein
VVALRPYFDTSWLSSGDDSARGARVRVAGEREVAVRRIAVS